MKVTVFGSGYVGLVTGACLSDIGHEVVCVDVDASKIARLIGGHIPIFEPGLDDVVARNMAKKCLSFTTNAAAAVAHGDVIFIAVGTPPGEDGSADLKYVLSVAKTIGEHLDHEVVIVTKSTVPVGTSDKVRSQTAQALAARADPTPSFHVVSNPEFLREGAAIEDFTAPDRIIVGASHDDAFVQMDKLYAHYVANGSRLIRMDVRSAELTKYASNAMLATRISFMNELAAIAEAVGADIENVRDGMGSDPRIGPHFLNAGCGYGGSCFPKDVKALIHTGRSVGSLPLPLLQSVEDVNATQKHILTKKIVAMFGDKLEGRTIAVWGLAFKPRTDDIREATSLVLIEALLQRGATVVAYDPVAIDTVKQSTPAHTRLGYAASPIDAARGADAIALVTEWLDFREQNFDDVGAVMRSRVLFDGRNCLDPQAMSELGFKYIAIGRAAGASR
jgi:UDPglucose 6-dehydrogenase